MIENFLNNKSQLNAFKQNEGDAWLNRNDKNMEIALRPRKFILDWCLERKNNISKILEIGAGNGIPLSFLCDKLEATGVGIEPSQKAVNLWKNKRKKIDGGLRTELINGDSSNLPFQEDSFDMVIFGFCLYLVDRNLLFRSISESDRVLKNNGLLVIIDFDVPKPYYNQYMNDNKLKSFKNNYSGIFTSSGHYTLVAKRSYSFTDNYFKNKIDERISVELLHKEEDVIYEN